MRGGRGVHGNAWSSSPPPSPVLSEMASFYNGQQSVENPYEGFDDYDHAYDLQVSPVVASFFQHIVEDKSFQQAVARSSHGRRPV